MEKENILVIGGTGKTGRRVVEILKAKGQNVFIGSRQSQPAFDWDAPSSYAQVLKNMDRVYIVYYPDLAVPGARDAIQKLCEEALGAGVEKVVLLSGKGEKEAEACEQIVANSGLNYTLVRASWFNQNFSEGPFVEMIQQGVLALPKPEAKIPFVDADDIAAVVSEVLLNDDYNGQTLTVTGSEQLSFEEVAQQLTQVIGKPIQYHAISLADYKEGMQDAGVPDDLVWLFAYLFEEILGNPSNQAVYNDTEKVLNRKAIRFEEYAKRTATNGVWSFNTVNT